MIKVFVTGFDKPYGIVGHLVSENEQHLIISENGVNKRINQDRIVYVEEFDSPGFVPEPQLNRNQFEPLTQPEPLPQTISETVREEPMPRNNPMLEALQEKIAQRKAERAVSPIAPERASQIDPEEAPPPYNPNDVMMIEVKFEGTKQGRFDISVPKGVMTGKYTPSLGREIFSHSEIKKVLADGTSILDGLPSIEGNQVVYTTKLDKAAEQTPQDRIQAMGQLANVGSKIMSGQSPISGSMPLTSSSMTSNDFSMPASPFQIVPTLTIDERDDD